MLLGRRQSALIVERRIRCRGNQSHPIDPELRGLFSSSSLAFPWPWKAHRMSGDTLIRQERTTLAGTKERRKDRRDRTALFSPRDSLQRGHPSCGTIPAILEGS